MNKLLIGLLVSLLATGCSSFGSPHSSSGTSQSGTSGTSASSPGLGGAANFDRNVFGTERGGG